MRALPLRRLPLRSGDLALAERCYRGFAESGFTSLPRDTNRFLGLAVLADVAVALGDVVGAATLADLLGPYRGQWVLLNCYGGGGGHWGPASHHLGRLAALLGRRAEAGRLLEEAASASGGAPLVAARIEEDRARLAAPAARCRLRAGSASGDR